MPRSVCGLGRAQPDRWSVRRGEAHDATHSRKRVAVDGRVVTLSALLVAALWTTGCATTGVTTAAPARWQGAEACTIDPTVVGTWISQCSWQ